MTLSNLFAHSRPDLAVNLWHRLDKHLYEVADCAAQFAEPFGSRDWAWNAGLLHDIGKASDIFQAYLRRSNYLDDTEYETSGASRINHSSAGAALAEGLFNRDGRPYGRALAYIVAGHHAGLPDFEPCDGGMGCLQKRLEEGRNHLLSIQCAADEVSAGLRPLVSFPSFVKAHNFHIWVRMLSSCLVDADYLNTEVFMQPEQSAIRAFDADMSELKSKLDDHIARLCSRSDNTSVNRIRREILDACRAAAKLKPGVFSLSVPTGGGKTLSSMAFALDHSALHNKRRVIYIIPYTSIIEQTAAVFADVFGDGHVVEHHSNLAIERDTLRAKLASENWDASIVVTTNVQFFESLYSAHPSRCRKLHNIANSVVILDEAQLVPPDKLTPCVAAMNELVNNYHVTLVLSSATLPVWPGLGDVVDIVSPSLELHERLRRVDIHVPDHTERPLTWEDIAARLQQHRQVLCIVNRRRDCYDLHKLMPEGTFHLSALMCGEHRSQKIREVKERLNRGEAVRVISTQLVEAGVDIDFPAVYRAYAGLDSISQAAGRCNREGKLETKGQVIVFPPPTI